MSARSRLAALVLLLIGALAAGPLAPASAASSDSTITTSRDAVIAGERFTVSGTLPSPSRQTFALQRYEDKAWSTVATQPSRGPFSFTTSTTTSARYRVVRSATTVKSTTTTVQVLVVAQRVRLDSPSRAHVGSPSTLSARTTPVRQGRTVSLQRRGADGAWTTIDRAVTGADGVASLSWTPSAVGDARLRAVASTLDGAPATVSGARDVTVADPLPMELPADVSDPRDGRWIRLSGEIPDDFVFRSDVAGYVVDFAIVARDSTFIVPAGVRIKCVRSANPCVRVVGVLKLYGTKQQPIVMTSAADDEVGGPVGGAPGGVTGGVTAQDQWTGLLTAGGGSVIADHVVARYASMFATATSDGSLWVRDSAIVESAGFLRAAGGSPGTIPALATVSDTTTVGSVEVSGQAAVDIERSTIKGSATVRVADSPARLALHESTLQDAPHIVNDSELSTFTDVTLSNDTQVDASALGASARWTNITPGSRGWWMRVRTDGLPQRALVWSARTTYVLPWGLTVSPGADLTLAPGAVLKFCTQCSLVVAGTLTARGTAVEHIVLTHTADVHRGTDVRAIVRPEDADPDGRFYGPFLNGGTFTAEFVENWAEHRGGSPYVAAVRD